MNVIIIGTGNIAKIHARAIYTLGHKIIAVVNKNLDSAKSFANEFNIPHVYSNIDSILDKNADIVHICTPPALHYDAIKLCLLSGKNVVSEKPLTLNENQAIELSNIATEKKLINAVCFNNRFYEANFIAKKHIENQKINFIHASYLQSFHCLPSEYSWRFSENVAGNMRAVTEIGSHVIDLIMYITGKDIIRLNSLFVKSNIRRTIKNGLMYPSHNGELVVNSEDAATINLILNDGTIANIVLSEVSHGKINELKYHIDCENKSISWNCENASVLDESDGVNYNINKSENQFEQSFVDMISNIYSSVEGGEVPRYANFAQAANVVKVCNAIYKSANSDGEFISL